MSFITKGKTNWKHLLIVSSLALSLMTLILLVVLVFRFWLLSPVEFALPQKTEEADKEEAAEWMTYRSEKYGFELRYPSEDFNLSRVDAICDYNLIADIIGAKGRYIFSITSKATIESSSVPPDTPQAEVMICLFTTDYEEAVKKYSEYSWKNSLVESLEIEIDGCRATMFEIERYPRLAVFIEKGEQLFYIELFGSLDHSYYEEETDAIFDQMISAFKFLE